MFRSFLLAVCALALAGRVAALQIALGGMTGNLTARQLLQVPSGPYLDQCTSNCSTVNSTIQACSDTDDNCVCTDDVAAGLVQCEQCMFNFLVAQNERAPDPRIGSNPSLVAYSAACNTSVGKLFPQAALTIAPTWDGPTDIILNTPATVVVVGFGSVLAGAAIMMLSNI
ncbi:hypothetical protein ACEPAF_1213 [Sanghuangporus sanghuang]